MADPGDAPYHVNHVLDHEPGSVEGSTRVPEKQLGRAIHECAVCVARRPPGRFHQGALQDSGPDARHIATEGIMARQ